MHRTSEFAVGVSFLVPNEIAELEASGAGPGLYLDWGRHAARGGTGADVPALRLVHHADDRHGPLKRAGKIGSGWKGNEGFSRTSSDWI